MSGENRKASCVERARPVDDEDTVPGSPETRSDSDGDYTRVHSRRNPSGARTAQRHQRNLWEDVFKTSYEALATDLYGKMSLDHCVRMAAIYADQAVAEWKQRFDSGMGTYNPTYGPADPVPPLGSETPPLATLSEQPVTEPAPEHSHACSTKKEP